MPDYKKMSGWDWAKQFKRAIKVKTGKDADVFVRFKKEKPAPLLDWKEASKEFDATQNLEDML